MIGGKYLKGQKKNIIADEQPVHEILEEGSSGGGEKKSRR